MSLASISYSRYNYAEFRWTLDECGGDPTPPRGKLTKVYGQRNGVFGKSSALVPLSHLHFLFLDQDTLLLLL